MLDNQTSLQEVFMWLGSEAVSFLRGWQKIELGSCDESDGEKNMGGHFTLTQLCTQNQRAN